MAPRKRRTRPSVPAASSTPTSLPSTPSEPKPDDDKTQQLLKTFDDAQATISDPSGFTIAGVAYEMYRHLIDWAVLHTAVDFKRALYLRAEALRIQRAVPTGVVVQRGGYGGGLRYSERNLTVECSNCGANISAARYAQHVEKCLGKGGRMSSRAASARLRASAERAEREGDLDDPPRRRRDEGGGKRRRMSPVPSADSQGNFRGLPPSGRTRASPR